VVANGRADDPRPSKRQVLGAGTRRPLEALDKGDAVGRRAYDDVAPEQAVLLREAVIHPAKILVTVDVQIVRAKEIDWTMDRACQSVIARIRQKAALRKQRMVLPGKQVLRDAVA